MVERHPVKVEGGGSTPSAPVTPSSEGGTRAFKCLKCYDTGLRLDPNVPRREAYKFRGLYPGAWVAGVCVCKSQKGA